MRTSPAFKIIMPTLTGLLVCGVVFMAVCSAARRGGLNTASFIKGSEAGQRPGIPQGLFVISNGCGRAICLTGGWDLQSFEDFQSGNTNRNWYDTYSHNYGPLETRTLAPGDVCQVKVMIPPGGRTWKVLFN